METTANMDFLSKIKRWEYYKPRHEDCNVVPYQASLLLVWGAHLNLQRINTTYWSYYLLKYAIKCEPHGLLNLNKKNAERLGLDGASDAQLKLMSSLIIARLVSPLEVELACLQIPIVQKIIVVKYIDSKPPTPRTKMVTKSKVLGFYPIDIYYNGPHEYEDMTFTNYFKRFDMERICRHNVPSFGKDKLRFYIYETPKIMRFINFHPTHNSDAFFFNVLIHTIPFRFENDLLSPTNNEKIISVNAAFFIVFELQKYCRPS